MDLPAAIELARRLHDGQVDKAGEPYLGHVLRVVEQVHDPDEKLVAALHDVLEDTAAKPAHLTSAGAPLRVVHAVEAMTRSEGEDYEQFCRRAATNPLSRAVKLADVADNADESRLGALSPEEADRLRRKYAGARAILLAAPTPCDSDPLDEFSSVGIPQGEEVATAILWCVSCGLPAGSAAVVRGAGTDDVQSSLVVHSFYATRSRPLSAEEAERAVEALTGPSVDTYVQAHRQDFGFWCRTCDSAYCADHWVDIAPRYDDGFFDCLLGTCSAGHRQKLSD